MEDLNPHLTKGALCHAPVARGAIGSAPLRARAVFWYLATLLLAFVPLTASAAGVVALLQVDGAITPASADYVERSLAKAQEQGAMLAVLQIDTPGGLDTSMRQIIKAILASRIPVATFVSPEGARAASAGTYILYASHIAAMAPATNLGAATPVPIGLPGTSPGESPSEKPTSKAKDSEPKKGSEPKGSEAAPPAAPADAMRAKQVNDASAYIRGLAELRGRNAEWAVRAVREGISLSASQALKENVIDLIAQDVPALLKALHGKEVSVQQRTVKIDTEAATLLTLAPDARSKFLAVITNPSVAVILMLIGVYGLFFEFSSPSFGLAGIAGGICLLLGLYALQLLPVNYAGLGLMALGLGLMVAEAFAPSFGVLGIGGIIAFILGATLLIDVEVPGFGIPLSLIATMALTSAALIIFVGGMAIRSRRRAVVSGREELIGAIGEVIDADGWVRLHGESWRAKSDSPLVPGQRVRVRVIEGLTLTVDAATAASPTQLKE